MTRINYKKGSALPIVIGLVVLVIIIGIFTLNGNNEINVASDSVNQNTENVEQKEVEGSSDDEMEEKEMDSDSDVKVEVEAEVDLAPVGSNSSAPGTYEDYDPSKLSKANSGDVVLFFHASWCPSCRNQEKDITSGDIPSGLTILKVNYDTETELKQKYGVRLQHSFVQVDAQGNAISKWAGGSTLEDVIKNVK